MSKWFVCFALSACVTPPSLSPEISSADSKRCSNLHFSAKQSEVRPLMLISMDKDFYAKTRSYAKGGGLFLAFLVSSKQSKAKDFTIGEATSVTMGEVVYSGIEAGDDAQTNATIEEVDAFEVRTKAKVDRPAHSTSLVVLFDVRGEDVDPTAEIKFDFEAGWGKKIEPISFTIPSTCIKLAKMAP